MTRSRGAPGCTLVLFALAKVKVEEGVHSDYYFWGRQTHHEIQWNWVAIQTTTFRDPILPDLDHDTQGQPHGATMLTTTLGNLTQMEF